MDNPTVILTFIVSIIGSGLTVALFNYYAEARKKRAEKIENLRRMLATVYDQLHHGQIQPEEFSKRASSLCIELDVLGYYKAAWVLRRYLGRWEPGSVVDTTEVKQLLFDVLEQLPIKRP